MKTVFKNDFNEKLVGELQNNGSKILAILVHGFKGNKDTLIFKNIENELKKIKIDSLRFDFSGCGESAGNYSQSTVNKQVDELNLIIKKSGYKKVILIGHSMGCTVSMIASSINPKISAMIFINPLVFPYITFNDSLVKYSPYVFLSKFDPDAIGLADKSENIRKTEEKVVNILKREVMGANMLNELKTLDLICLAKGSKIPLLIIHGKRDELIPLSHAEYLNYNVKNSKLVVLNYFHSPFLKKDISEVSSQVIAFAKKLKEKFLK